MVACGTIAPTPVMVPTVVPGPVKLVTLGDSQTAGYGDERVGKPEAGGYPAMLIVPIISLRAGSRVKNLGQGAWTSTDLLHGNADIPSQLQPALAEHPTVICIWIGMNDLIYFNSPDREQSSLQAYEANLDTILATLSGHGATLAIALLDDPSLRPGIANGTYAINYDWYRQSKDHVQDFARLRRRTADFNRVIKDKAAQYGTLVVDLPLTGVFSNPQLMSTDGIHPSSKGYQVLANAWLEALLPILGNVPTLHLTLTLPY